MCTTTKILKRKIFNQLGIFISAVFIVVLSVLFFVAVQTVYIDFEKAGREYFDENNLNDIEFSGIYNATDVRNLNKIKGVNKVETKYKFQGRVENYKTDAVIYGIKNQDDRIDMPYVYEGKTNLSGNEIALNHKYAKEYNLKIGDTLSIEIKGKIKDFSIASIVSYPNYVFLFKDGVTYVSKPNELAVIEVNEDYFKNDIPFYNSIYLTYDGSRSVSDTEKDVLKKIERKTFYFINRNQSPNYANYKQTLLQINAFSYICPIILLIMAALLLYVIQRRNVSVERKQIGIMKALGLNDYSIIFMYMRYSFIVVFLGVISSYIILQFLFPPVFGALKLLFDIPKFTHHTYPRLWVISFLIIIIISSLSNFMAAISILKLNPVQSMRGQSPKSGKKLFFENIKSWSKLSFNTRYSVKNSFRGKTRYFASVWGMFVAVAMTIFAQGFNNSFSYFIDNLYTVFAKYDASVLIAPMSAGKKIKFIESEYEGKKIITHTDQASVYQARISGNKKEKNVQIDNPALIYENLFTSLNIPYDKDYDKGVMISKSLAKRLGVQKGDYIEIEIFMFGKISKSEVMINEIVEQPGMFFVYMERDFAKRVFDAPDTYNTLYLRSDNTEALKKLLDDNNDNILSYNLKQTEMSSSKEQMATISLLVKILILVAFLLGAVSLYGVGIVTLATRKYEFTLLKVMGYSTAEIMLASIKETVSQIILAILLGVFAGWAILHLIKNSFSSDFIDFIPHVYDISYIYAVLLLLVTVIFVSFISSKFISKLDMVEGLKEREE